MSFRVVKNCSLFGLCRTRSHNKAIQMHKLFSCLSIKPSILQWKPRLQKKSLCDWSVTETLLSHHKMASLRCSDAGDPPQAHGPKKHHDGEGLSLFWISLAFKAEIDPDFHSPFAHTMPGLQRAYYALWTAIWAK